MRTRRAVAVLGALAGVAIVAVRGLEPEVLELVAFVVVLAVISAIDIESRRIPNILVGAAALVRAAYLCHLGVMGNQEFAPAAVSSLLGAIVLGVGLLVVTLVVDKLFGGSNFGGGDIKLLAVAGFYFGVSRGLLVVLIACVLGVAWSFIERARGVDGAGAFSFGPSIALACVLVILMP